MNRKQKTSSKIFVCVAKKSRASCESNYDCKQEDSSPVSSHQSSEKYSSKKSIEQTRTPVCTTNSKLQISEKQKNKNISLILQSRLKTIAVASSKEKEKFVTQNNTLRVIRSFSFQHPSSPNQVWISPNMDGIATAPTANNQSHHVPNLKIELNVLEDDYKGGVRFYGNEQETSLKHKEMFVTQTPLDIKESKKLSICEDEGRANYSHAFSGETSKYQNKGSVFIAVQPLQTEKQPQRSRECNKLMLGYSQFISKSKKDASVQALAAVTLECVSYPSEANVECNKCQFDTELIKNLQTFDAELSTLNSNNLHKVDSLNNIPAFYQEQRKPPQNHFLNLFETCTFSPSECSSNSSCFSTVSLDLNKLTPEYKYGSLLPSNRSPLRLLLVFPQSDSVSEALSKAGDKVGFDVTLVFSYETALDDFLLKLHDLVIVDSRPSPKLLDCDTLCRSIKNTKGSQHTVVAAIVKKSAFDKDDITVLSLLDAGYARCIIETTSVICFVNELNQLKHSDIRPTAQSVTNHALYAALDRCNNIVLITDDSYRLQYANRATERTLGYRREETLGKAVQEHLITDNVQQNGMHMTLQRLSDWEGQISLRRKGQEPLVTSCNAVPVSCSARAVTHFVLIFDSIHQGIELPIATPDKPRGSMHSLRRISMDVRSTGSDYIRRTSLAKLSSLPLEAPITRVIGLLAEIQEQSNPQSVILIDKVVDILRSTELYSPQLREDLRDRIEEPLTSDLISALLMQPIPSSINASRRSSNDSSAVRGVRVPAKTKLGTPLRDLLDSSLSWEFDIFRLEDLSNKRPLVHLGMNLMLHFDVPNTLQCDEKTLYNWLSIIEMNYHSQNPYHNSTHAADVLQATAGFLERDRMKSIMEPLDEATSLIAASAHDIDHPGRSSAFLSNCDNPIAILYNDVTVLENHHAALTFKLTLGDERVNIFKNLDRETYKLARHYVIDMILATEMTKHFEHLAKFVNVFCSKPSRSELEISDDCSPLTLPENITLVKRMMIKCADVSNPTRPLRLCVEWARRIAEEYFAQTEEEKIKGLPIVMPMFDRATCSIPKSQIGFVDYIVHDMFEAWDAFIDMPEIVTYMRQNYMRWKEFDDQGHTTSADIRKLQKTVLVAPIFPGKGSQSKP